MSHDTSGDDEQEIRTAAEFDAALTRILRSAVENGVDPGGSWEIRNGASKPDWEVQIFELQKED
jgi:hypothetical protein